MPDKNRKARKKMKDGKELLAYCGLYCGDCLGYTGLVAKRAKSLMAVLEKHQFDRTAKSVFSVELRDYDRFREMLGFMAGLRCPKICRKREDTETSCKIRACCIDKGFYACYECDDFEICGKLKSFMQGLHAESCVRNLRAIKEMGLEAWIKKGEKFWYWSE